MIEIVTDESAIASECLKNVSSKSNKHSEMAMNGIIDLLGNPGLKRGNVRSIEKTCHRFG
jgi:hypothetical protein